MTNHNEEYSVLGAFTSIIVGLAESAIFLLILIITFVVLHHVILNIPTTSDRALINDGEINFCETCQLKLNLDDTFCYNCGNEVKNNE